MLARGRPGTVRTPPIILFSLPSAREKEREKAREKEEERE